MYICEDIQLLIDSSVLMHNIKLTIEPVKTVSISYLEALITSGDAFQ